MSSPDPMRLHGDPTEPTDEDRRVATNRAYWLAVHLAVELKLAGLDAGPALSLADRIAQEQARRECPTGYPFLGVDVFADVLVPMRNVDLARVRAKRGR